MHYFSWVALFLQSSQPVITVTEKLSSKNKAFSITTYYFSTLHTNIPRNKLKNVMRELIYFCIKNGGKTFCFCDRPWRYMD